MLLGNIFPFYAFQVQLNTLLDLPHMKSDMSWAVKTRLACDERKVVPHQCDLFSWHDPELMGKKPTLIFSYTYISVSLGISAHWQCMVLSLHVHRVVCVFQLWMCTSRWSLCLKTTILRHWKPALLSMVCCVLFGGLKSIGSCLQTLVTDISC